MFLVLQPILARRSSGLQHPPRMIPGHGGHLLGREGIPARGLNILTPDLSFTSQMEVVTMAMDSLCPPLHPSLRYLTALVNILSSNPTPYLKWKNK